MRQIIAAVIIMLSTMLHAQPGGLNGKSVYIYTRNGEGYVHDNIAASVEALEEICTSMGVSTEHTDDPAIFSRLPGTMSLRAAACSLHRWDIWPNILKMRISGSTRRAELSGCW